MDATVDLTNGSVRFGEMKIYDPEFALAEIERVIDRLMGRVVFVLMENGWTRNADGTWRRP